MKRILFPIIAIAVIMSPVRSVSATEPASPWIREALGLVNGERASHGLSELTLDGTLSRAAELKLSDMEKNGYFAHTSPAKRTPWSFFDEAGYDYRYAGENLAIHFKDPETEHDAWMESEKHCQNILDSRFRETGMAVRKVFMEGRETILTVQLFGTENGEESIGSSSGKEAAIAMCRGESVPVVSGTSEDREDGSPRIALVTAGSADMFVNAVFDLLRLPADRPGTVETLAVIGFAIAQMITVSVSVKILLAREYEDGVYPS